MARAHEHSDAGRGGGLHRRQGRRGGGDHREGVPGDRLRPHPARSRPHPASARQRRGTPSARRTAHRGVGILPRPRRCGRRRRGATTPRHHRTRRRRRHRVHLRYHRTAQRRDAAPRPEPVGLHRIQRHLRPDACVPAARDPAVLPLLRLQGRLDDRSRHGCRHLPPRRVRRARGHADDLDLGDHPDGRIPHDVLGDARSSPA